MQQELAELERVMAVLDGEKASRVKASSELRGQVRTFIQQQIDAYKAFLVTGQLMDYVGAELLTRTTQDPEPILMVDFENEVPAAGSLTGVMADFNQSGSLAVRVLRPIGDG